MTRTRSSELSLPRKRTHLLGAGETRFVEHVKVPIGGVDAWVILNTGEETLKGRCVDASVAELARGLGCGSKTFHDIVACFRSSADRLESRGFSAAGQSLEAVNAIG